MAGSAAGRSIDEQRQAGKSRRATLTREALGQTLRPDRDVVEMIRRAADGRVPALIALRHARMLASPFAFFRGAAGLQAFDLGGEPDTGLDFPICGDSHLLNFGGFATPERHLVFDLNDFDEADAGPWEWDLKRLAASVHIAAGQMGHGPGTAEEATYHAAAAYQAGIRKYAAMGALEIIYQRHRIADLLETLDDDEARRRLRQLMRRAARRTHEELLPRISEMDGDDWRIRDAPPAVFHLFGSATLLDAGDDWMRLEQWRAIIGPMYRKYLSTLIGDRRAILDSFRMQDLVFKVVGVGSVGTRCLVLLLADHHGKPLFLQIKEARPSVLSRRTGKQERHAHQGRRVVEGQRRLQSASDLFLGWTTGPSGRHFYVRQLRDMKVSASIETYDGGMLTSYAATCGEVLARAHAKAGGRAAEIEGYMGKSDAVPAAMVAYARSYAEQVERDFDLFRAACRRGDLPVQTEEEFLADLTV